MDASDGPVEASAVKDGETEQEQEQEQEQMQKPQIAPEDMPKVSLDILMQVHQAQAGHGLRRTVPDYERYRTYVTRLFFFPLFFFAAHVVRETDGVAIVGSAPRNWHGCARSCTSSTARRCLRFAS